ncbi:MAG TPA: hypothetical protein VFC31_15215 [Candidatus Limnocylindria bacterium]|nr:hypothetical protein [Candidatus Limnocylindria bacterium]
MPDATAIRRIASLSLALLVARIATAFVVSQPGYTDSFYFTAVADRLAQGAGLTADFLWSPLEARADLGLPVASHLFWVPLPTGLAALGVALAGPLAGAFRAAQLPFILTAALLPGAAYVAARALGTRERFALAAAAIAGCGGLFAPAFVSVDAFAPAALMGTAFFLAYARAAAGSTRAGLVAGLLVGLLYLSRSEGALFGLALLWLVRTERSRRAGVAASLVALAFGCAWLVRDLSAGLGAGLFARSALLVRYEDLFAFQPDYIGASAAPAIDLVTARAAALVTNAVTFTFAFALLLVVPLAAGVRGLRDRPEVRAWLGLAVLVYLAQSLVWTLHSTRGSYFHSLAAFFPFGVAIAAAGAERLLTSLARRTADAWIAGAVVLVAIVSVTSVAQWDASFNGGTRARASALDAIPAGPFLAIDAAAWRWISGRRVAVTPADGLARAACVAAAIDARSIVLEAAHFSRYDALYRGGARPAWLDAPVVRGATRVYPIRGVPPCGAP